MGFQACKILPRGAKQSVSGHRDDDTRNDYVDRWVSIQRNDSQGQLKILRKLSVIVTCSQKIFGTSVVGISFLVVSLIFGDQR